MKKAEAFLEDFQQEGQSGENLIMAHNFLQLKTISSRNFFHLIFQDYLKNHREIIKESRRVLKKNGAIFWNVAQTVQEGEILPLGAIFYNIFNNPSLQELYFSKLFPLIIFIACFL